MTATAAPAGHGIDFEPDGDDRRLDALTPGAAARMEALGRPWRLSLVGIGILVTAGARLFALNGVGDLGGATTTFFNASGMLIAAAGLLVIASHRDRLGGGGWVLAATTAVASAMLGWLSPRFRAGTLDWDSGQQLLGAFHGLAVGLLLAGIIAAALIRRSPTLTMALLVLAGLLTLATNTVLGSTLYPSIGVVVLAFGLLLAAWDQSPRREVTFGASDPPRAVRAGLSLATVTIAGLALQHWTGRDRNVPNGLPAIALVVLAILVAFAALWLLRREVQQRTNPLSEWTSWMREIRTNEFRGELAAYRTATREADGGLVFVDLDDAAADVDFTNFDGSSIQGGGFAADLARATEVTAASASAFRALVASEALGTPAPAAEAPDPRVAAPADLAAHAPVAAAGAPAAPPAPAVPAQPPAAPSVTPQDLGVADTSDLDAWLRSSAGAGENRLFFAIEAVPITVYDELDRDAQTGAITAVARHLGGLDPQPELVAWLDGPYFMLALHDDDGSAMPRLNRQLQPLMQAALNFRDFRVQLDGTLAILRPDAHVDLDTLLDEAIDGLRQARRVQSGGRA